MEMEMFPLRRRKTHSGHASNSDPDPNLARPSSSSSADVTLTLDPASLSKLPNDYDNTSFKAYNVLNSGFTGNLALCPGNSDSSIPTYFVTNSTFTVLYHTPDIVLRSGTDKSCPVLGVARLPLCGPNPMGIGDPDAGAGGKNFGAYRRGRIRGTILSMIGAMARGGSTSGFGRRRGFLTTRMILRCSSAAREGWFWQGMSVRV